MPLGTTGVVLAIAVLALAGGSLAMWFVRRSRRDAAAIVYHFRCPNCGRRLRFFARQVGNKGQCSNCGQAVTFPATSKSVD